MVNLLKEIARRVTLLDILEESKQADKFQYRYHRHEHEPVGAGRKRK